MSANPSSIGSRLNDIDGGIAFGRRIKNFPSADNGM
jgi:hypothetical protein